MKQPRLRRSSPWLSSSSDSVSLWKSEGGHLKEYAVLFLFLASGRFLITSSTLFISPSNRCLVRDLKTVWTSSPLALFVSRPSLLYPLSSSPDANPRAALNLVLPHPPLIESAATLLSPNDVPHTPRSCTLPTKLPPTQMERTRIAGTAPSTMVISPCRGNQNTSLAPRSTQFPPSPISRVLGMFLIFLPHIQSDFGRVALSLTPTIQRAPPSLPLIHWTRLHAVSQRLKASSNSLTPNARLAPKSPNLLIAEPGTAPLSLESPRSPLKKRNRAKSLGHPVA